MLNELSFLYPSTASTAKGEKHLIREILHSRAKSNDMKFPAAPESNMAHTDTVPVGRVRVTGTVMQLSILRARMGTLTRVAGSQQVQPQIRKSWDSMENANKKRK